MKERISGLDSIRFVCAFLVSTSHFAQFNWIPEANSKNVGAAFTNTIYNIYNNLVFHNGPQSVIIFFVISGFCIHFPYVNLQKPNYPQYYIRRYTRIGIPFLMVGAIFLFLGLGESVLWSVEAEIIYYTLYPVLMKLKERFGWKILLTTTFCLSYLIILFGYIKDNTDTRYQGQGILFTWLIGLPCWLLGCYLAETSRNSNLKVRYIWFWRATAVGGCLVVSTLALQLSVGFNWTLNLLSIIVFFWLAREVVYFRKVQPFVLLESAGKWSYSLYLCHIIVIWLFAAFSLSLPYWVLSIAIISITLLVSYTFYLLVEKPAHKLAKNLSLVYSTFQSKRAFRKIEEGSTNSNPHPSLENPNI